MLKINIVNQYNEDKSYDKTIKKVLKVANKHLKLKGSFVINVILINNEEIQGLNRTYRDIDRPTDVLSFENDSYGLELGDIFISIDKTIEQAVEYDHSFERELAFLTVHGFLHCLGYDHLTEEDEKEMIEIQKEILEIARIRRLK